MAADTRYSELPKWDHASGIRERLALLAHFGPTLNPHNYGYHPSKDYWYYCGADDVAVRGSRVTIKVRQEGSASLAMIESKWSIGRVQAMAMIGYPEATR